MNKRITIAIQKKGRLSNSSKSVLRQSGISFSTNGEKLLARASNFDIDILLVRDDDIPSLVDSKVCDLAIVGENVLIEQNLAYKYAGIKKVLDLGFSKCRLEFAKPQNSKLRGFTNKTIATSYPFIVNEYLKKKKIKAKVVKIHGSVELTPYIGIADYICDLVSSGATLEANNLVEFKTVLKSQAVLITQKNLTPSKERIILKLIERIKGVINAFDCKYVMLNTDSKNISQLCKLLPGSESPTIIPLEKENKVAIHAFCKEPVFWETMEKLKSNGASSILVLPVEKILN